MHDWLNLEQNTSQEPIRSRDVQTSIRRKAGQHINPIARQDIKQMLSFFKVEFKTSQFSGILFLIQLNK